jgi:hypothetical protein
VTTRTARCSRGRLLREFREECWRASSYIGTRGMGPAGQRLIDDARGRATRHLFDTWHTLRVLPHMNLITKIFDGVERREIMG